MNLQAFLPCRLAVLSEAVGRCVAQAYREQFGLTRDEWRVLAALAESHAMKSTAAALHTTLDKMQVSRACTRLESRGLIARDEDRVDRRNKVLRLTPDGRALLAQMVPAVEAREAELIAALDPADLAALDIAIDKLLAQARAIAQTDAAGSEL